MLSEIFHSIKLCLLHVLVTVEKPEVPSGPFAQAVLGKAFIT